MFGHTPGLKNLNGNVSNIWSYKKKRASEQYVRCERAGASRMQHRDDTDARQLEWHRSDADNGLRLTDGEEIPYKYARGEAYTARS